MMHGASRWKDFSTADHLALELDAAWEQPKEEGNKRLKEGDHLGAAKLYRDAALLAMGPLEGGAIHAFISALEAWPEGSAQRQFVENEDLLWTSLVERLPVQHTQRDMQLPDGGSWTAKFPNKGAAVAWANRAQALLLAGAPDRALRSARRAADANPEYLKGHHRVVKALEALGRREAAAELRQQIREYPLARSMYPAESLALLHAGWIDWKRASMIYGPTRFRAAAEHVAAALQEGERKRVEVRASLVPFQGGQCLMLTLVYGLSDEVQCMDFQMVDNRNADICDRPPNGHASPKALEHAPMRIGVFIEELADYGLAAVAVMCGQGLTEHVALVERQLKQGCPQGMHPPFEGLVVYAAASTAASEDSGVAPPLLSSPAAMAATMARLGLGP